MIKHTISDGKITYLRITKRQARKLFDAGKDVVFCPVKLRPGFPLAPHMDFRKSDYLDESIYPHNSMFDKLVCNFAWYNCQLNETGYYPAFYITRIKL